MCEDGTYSTKGDHEEIGIFRGKPVAYWVEIERMVKEHNLEKVMDEFMLEKAKVTYYEYAMNQFRTLSEVDPSLTIKR